VEAGFEVTLLVKAEKDERVNDVNIVALSTYKSKYRRFILSSWQVVKRALSIKSSIYHFHDPELLMAGFVLRMLGKKVIYDVHENVPAQILTKQWLGGPAVRKAVSFAANILEKILAVFMTRIVVVTEEIGNRFNPKKVVLLRNLPVIGSIKNAPRKDKGTSKKVIVYSGGLTMIRGIKEIIQSMEFVEHEVELWLLGAWESDSFKQDCMSVNGWSVVKEFGFVPLMDVFGYQKAADIGLVNFLPVPNHYDALPNKPFEYMACGLPIVMTNFPKWVGFFSTCALFVNCDDPKDISQKINTLLSDDQLADKLGENGRKLVFNELSWEVESRKLIDMYKQISGIE